MTERLHRAPDISEYKESYRVFKNGEEQVANPVYSPLFAINFFAFITTNHYKYQLAELVKSEFWPKDTSKKDGFGTMNTLSSEKEIKNIVSTGE